ncbi:MAG TPA: amidohydrolase [Sphingobacteriaceae bacterium]|nr:amidohydrolase [Sphingobacteriaceae bacterium]
MTINYTADYILPVSSDPVKNGVVTVNEHGLIMGVYERDSPEIKDKPVKAFSGIIVPGFINSHCHLELSHLHQKIEKHQGLIPFIKNVIRQRGLVDKDLHIETMQQADKTMFENGIVAVGDISNTDISKEIKEKSPIYYHTYIELLGIDPGKAKDIFKSGLSLKERFSPMPASIVPHAPYSVSKALFKEINDLSKHAENKCCMHNQESKEENTFFRYKTGKFVDFYKDLNLDIDYFKPQAKNSVQSIILLLPKDKELMLVHNTYTSLKDIYFIRRTDRNITWCFCPNANLFIENRLPKIELFLLDGVNITLGTDSLASNEELSILSELKTLQSYFSELPLTRTINWATLNGARFLSIEDRFGSIERGKKPGLNLITDMEGLKLTEKSKVQKII